MTHEPQNTTRPPVTDRASWQAELDGLLAREKAHTREGDAIAAARRRLPMVEVDAAIPVTASTGQFRCWRYSRAARSSTGRSANCRTCIRAMSPSPRSARARTRRASPTSWAGECCGTRRGTPPARSTQWVTSPPGADSRLVICPAGTRQITQIRMTTENAIQAGAMACHGSAEPLTRAPARARAHCCSPPYSSRQDHRAVVCRCSGYSWVIPMAPCTWCAALAAAPAAIPVRIFATATGATSQSAGADGRPSSA